MSYSSIALLGDVATCAMPYEDVVQAVVDLADHEGHPLPLHIVVQLPLHLEAERQFPDSTLQHRSVPDPHHQLAVVEADALHTEMRALPQLSETDCADHLHRYQFVTAIPWISRPEG